MATRRYGGVRRRRRGKEVASLPLVVVERHEVVVEERVVSRGISIEELWREYETAKRLLEIAEAVGDEVKAKIQRERLENLENEIRDAVLDENLVEDFRGY